MGRPKAFDRDRALALAVKAFRSRGYESTSIQNLVDSMGIHRASLYDTYGSKQELFLEVLGRYTQNVRETLFQELEPDGPAKETLRRFFDKAVGELCSDEGQACLMVRTALSPEAPWARDVVREHMDELDGRFQKVLEAGCASGALRADLPVAATATFLRNSYEGLVVSSAVQRDPEQLNFTVDCVLRVLD